MEKENKFYSSCENYPFLGLDELVKKTYIAIDLCSESADVKRNILFSLYSFRCLFDNAPLYKPSKTLLKYAVSFLTDSKYKNFEGVYEITDKNGKTRYKFDAGSPLYIKFLKEGKFDKFAYLPQKYTLYELVYKIITLSTATHALKASWYCYVPFIFLIGAPVEHDLLADIKRELFNEKVFNKVLHSEDGDCIYVDEESIAYNDPLLRDWYVPYIQYRREKANGTARYNERIEEIIKKGDFRKAMYLSKAYVCAYPEDEDLAILDITARLALCASAEGEERKQLLLENGQAIGDALSSTVNRRAELLYYSAMTKLALLDIDGAEKDLIDSLQADPNFEKSKKMLEGFKNAENKFENDKN